MSDMEEFENTAWRALEARPYRNESNASVRHLVNAPSMKPTWKIVIFIDDFLCVGSARRVFLNALLCSRRSLDMCT